MSSRAPAAAPSGLGYVVLIAVAAALGGFLFGYDTAVVNGTVGALERHFKADPGRLGFAVASALLGSAVGALIAGRVADRWGRIPAMKLTALLFAASSIGSGIAESLLTFSTWRFLGGIAVGAASVIAPAYIAEVAPARIRGRLGSLQQLAIVTGIFLALGGQRPHRPHRGVSGRALLVRHPGVAVDVLRRGAPGRRLRPRRRSSSPSPRATS